MRKVDWIRLYKGWYIVDQCTCDPEDSRRQFDILLVHIWRKDRLCGPVGIYKRRDDCRRNIRRLWNMGRWLDMGSSSRRYSRLCQSYIDHQIRNQLKYIFY